MAERFCWNRRLALLEFAHERSWVGASGPARDFEIHCQYGKWGSIQRRLARAAGGNDCFNVGGGLAAKQHGRRRIAEGEDRRVSDRHSFFQRKPLSRAGLRSLDQSAKFGVRFYQFINKRTVRVRLKRLDRDQAMIRQLNNQGLARTTTVTQSAFRIPFF